MKEKVAILYVDDEPINLELFEINFEEKYTVLTAISGLKAFEVLREKQGIVVVISDMKMHGMNGLEFVVKAKQEFPDLVYFILTGFDISPELAEALNKGVIQKYLYKPFDLLAIEKAIENAIAQKK